MWAFFGRNIESMGSKAAPSSFVTVLCDRSLRTGHASTYMGGRVTVCEYAPGVLHVPHVPVLFGNRLYASHASTSVGG
jgi:hypothetical protein